MKKWSKEWVASKLKQDGRSEVPFQGQTVAQGDLTLVRIDAFPQNLKKVPAKAGVHVLQHSETGHHHVVDASKADLYTAGDAFVAFLEVTQEAAHVRHLRGHDTHKTIVLPPGKFRVCRQTEYTPEGLRAVAD